MQGYFQEFKTGGGIDKSLGGVNIRKKQIDIKKSIKKHKKYIELGGGGNPPPPF